jgi:uncharacterized protein YdeI (YjbR/CyaY-like superfamily)
MPAPPKLVAKTFQAVLERSGDRLNWTIVRVPLDVYKVWGVRGQLRVKGEINRFAFRTSLFPTGNGTHLLMVNKAMQAGGKVTPGMKARFRLEPDTEKRAVAPPEELLRELGQSKRLVKFYESFNYSIRREIARWVGLGKQPETRRRRAQQLGERLMETMEAERQLPPLIERSLAQNPLARQGWQLMPAGARRSHLMGIFYYRDPESRARRLAKAVEAMVEYAEKRKERSLPRIHADERGSKRRIDLDAI